jgi:hypothetical protein
MDAMTPIELDSSALSSTVAFTGRLACMTPGINRWKGACFSNDLSRGTFRHISGVNCPSAVGHGTD